MNLRVPGKIHLIGEHSVVYGHPALLAAGGLYTHASLKPSPMVSIFFPAFDSKPITATVAQALEIAQSETELSRLKADQYRLYRLAAVGIALRELGCREGAEIEIRSEIPAGAGMGSSAAFALAISFGLARMYGIQGEKSELNRIAFEIEKRIHGSPSGGDNTTCCFGGWVWFQKKGAPQFQPLNREIPVELQNFMVVQTAPPQQTTGELVAKVRRLDASAREPVMENLGRLAVEMRQALRGKDTNAIVQIMNQAQKNLHQLNVSTPQIDNICRSVQEIGGGAKLCGAGGGGTVLCFHPDQAVLREVLSRHGKTALSVPLGVSGICEVPPP